MSIDSILYEITLCHNGQNHVVDSLCLDTSEVTLIKAIKSSIESLKSLGFEGPIEYRSHQERSLLPEFLLDRLVF